MGPACHARMPASSASWITLSRGGAFVACHQHVAFDGDILLQQVRGDVLERRHHHDLVAQEILGTLASAAGLRELHGANLGRNERYRDVDQDLARESVAHGLKGRHLVFGGNRQHDDVSSRRRVRVFHRVGRCLGADLLEVCDGIAGFFEGARTDDDAVAGL